MESMGRRRKKKSQTFNAISLKNVYHSVYQNAQNEFNLAQQDLTIFVDGLSALEMRSVST